MRIGLFVMCLLFLVSFAFATQAPGLPVSEPQPPTMEFRVNEYRNMVIASLVISALGLVGTTFLLITGFFPATLLTIGVSLLWMAVVGAVSRGIRRTLQQEPDVYAGSEVEKKYHEWRGRMVWSWFMTALPVAVALAVIYVIYLFDLSLV